MYSGMLEANGGEVTEWLRSPGFESKLFSFFPCTDILPTSANKVCNIRKFLQEGAYHYWPSSTRLS